jgi:hypothetical protein
MKIKVKAKNAWSERECALAYSAAVWASEELGIDVSPVPVVIKLKEETLDYGDSVDLHHKIVIRLFKSENWLRTLFHEMEHARQYLFGELMLEVDYVIWQGEMTRRNEEYWFTPWEVEARRVEEELYERFVKKFLDSTSSL